MNALQNSIKKKLKNASTPKKKKKQKNSPKAKVEKKTFNY